MFTTARLTEILLVHFLKCFWKLGNFSYQVCFTILFLIDSYRDWSFL